jgi:hypothetical protein
MPAGGGDGPIRSTNELDRARPIGERHGHVVSLGISTLIVQTTNGCRFHAKLDDWNRDLVPGDAIGFTLHSDGRLTVAHDVVKLIEGVS